MICPSTLPMVFFPSVGLVPQCSGLANQNMRTFTTTSPRLNSCYLWPMIFLRAGHLRPFLSLMCAVWVVMADVVAPPPPPHTYTFNYLKKLKWYSVLPPLPSATLTPPRSVGIKVVALLTRGSTFFYRALCIFLVPIKLWQSVSTVYRPSVCPSMGGSVGRRPFMDGSMGRCTKLVEIYLTIPFFPCRVLFPRLPHPSRPPCPVFCLTTDRQMEHGRNHVLPFGWLSSLQRPESQNSQAPNTAEVRTYIRIHVWMHSYCSVVFFVPWLNPLNWSILNCTAQVRICARIDVCTWRYSIDILARFSSFFVHIWTYRRSSIKSTSVSYL